MGGWEGGGKPAEMRLIPHRKPTLHAGKKGENHPFGDGTPCMRPAYAAHAAHAHPRGALMDPPGAFSATPRSTPDPTRPTRMLVRIYAGRAPGGRCRPPMGAEMALATRRWKSQERILDPASPSIRAKQLNPGPGHGGTPPGRAQRKQRKFLGGSVPAALVPPPGDGRLAPLGDRCRNTPPAEMRR